MMWFFAILVVLVLGGIAMVAAGWGRPLAQVDDDRPDTGLPDDGPLGAADLRRARFPLAVRGYRMAEVDALLARLADQLDQAPGPSDGGRDDAASDERPEPGQEPGRGPGREPGREPGER